MAMTRAQLNQAFREVASMEFADIPWDEAAISFSFSDKFLQKMEKLIARQKKPYWEYVNTVKKRVAIVAVVCLSLFVTACSNEEFREPIIRQMEKLEGMMRHYFIEGDARIEIENKYYLTTVPDEFELVLELGDSGWHMVRYQDKEGNCIEFSQYASDGLNYNVEDEMINEYSIEIRESEVLIFEYSDSIRAIWTEDGYGMGLIYKGCTEVNVIIEMIESMRFDEV